MYGVARVAVTARQRDSLSSQQAARRPAERHVIPSRPAVTVHTGWQRPTIHAGGWWWAATGERRWQAGRVSAPNSETTVPPSQPPLEHWLPQPWGGAVAGSLVDASLAGVDPAGVGSSGALAAAAAEGETSGETVGLGIAPCLSFFRTVRCALCSAVSAEIVCG
jgi:hypothetical protein